MAASGMSLVHPTDGKVKYSLSPATILKFSHSGQQGDLEARIYRVAW